MNQLSFLKIIFLVSCYGFSTFSVADDKTLLSEVAGHYVTKIRTDGKAKKPVSHEWFFWRTADMIQTRDANGDQGEIWQKTANDSIQYRKLYHNDKTAVEYMPADMPTNNMNFDWFKLSNMLSQQELDRLKPIKKTKVLGRDAELRKGKINDQTIEVLWLIKENLPAHIVKKDQKGSIELSLMNITSFADSPKKLMTVEEINNYRQIDAADFGDMENDPFVKKTMSKEGHHH